MIGRWQLPRFAPQITSVIMRRAVEIRPAPRRDTFAAAHPENARSADCRRAVTRLRAVGAARQGSGRPADRAWKGDVFGGRPKRVNVQTTGRRVPESGRSVLCGGRSAMSVTTAIDRCLHFTS